jgi:threonine/homoserine/homoserine lactone efflux protein
MTTFLLASLLLALFPGPGVLYIVGCSVSQGRRSGLVSAAAMAVGNLVCGVVVALVLNTLAGISSGVLATLRYAGAAYLFWLGLRTILAMRKPADAQPLPLPRRRVFVDGLMVALLNPKTLVFFAAFLPQFMDARRPSLLQGSWLAALFVLMAFITDSGYAIAAGWIARPLQQSRQTRAIAGIIGGGVYIALGMFAVLA